MLARHLTRLGSWTKECQGEEWTQVRLDPAFIRVQSLKPVSDHQDLNLEAYKYTKTAVALDPEWYRVLDQFTEYALDLLDSKYVESGHEKLCEEAVQSLVLPACYCKDPHSTCPHPADRNDSGSNVPEYILATYRRANLEADSSGDHYMVPTWLKCKGVARVPEELEGNSTQGMA